MSSRSSSEVQLPVRVADGIANCNRVADIFSDLGFNAVTNCVFDASTIAHVSDAIDASTASLFCGFDQGCAVQSRNGKKQDPSSRLDRVLARSAGWKAVASMNSLLHACTH